MKIFETYNICRTGKTKQYFTLYIERFLINGCFEKESCFYVQNLSHDRDIAIDKVEKIVKERKIWASKHLEDHSIDIDFYDSKKREYCDLKAFGMEWKKSVKGFYIRIDHLPLKEDQQMIWDMWQTDKDLLKNAGFSVFVGKDKGQWFFFFKNCDNEEMDIKFSVLKAAKTNKVVQGSFIGKIKDRIKIKTIITDIKERNSQYGLTRIITFKINDNIGISFYTGKKELPEIGIEFDLVGTVKCHKKYNGINQTIFNRISF